MSRDFLEIHYNEENLQTKLFFIQFSRSSKDVGGDKKEIGEKLGLRFKTKHRFKMKNLRE